MERWFPEHNVRYVAVLDGVDTYVPDSANNDMAPIKNCCSSLIYLWHMSIWFWILLDCSSGVLPSSSLDKRA